MESPRDILKRHGLRPKHSWGQNFLGDEEALQDIADALALREGEPVVELGPGLGHLTRFLAATGARVTAVERDRDMIAVLEKEAIPGVKVVAGNAADVDFAQVAGVPEVAVAGNLPYHLSSSILFQVLAQRTHVTRAVFTLQKEVVERLAAEPGNRDYGLLTVLLGLHFQAEQVLTLEAWRFHPPPKVDSAVLRLTRLAAPRAPITDDARFTRLVKSAFAHRRKTLLNSLKSDSELASPEQLVAALATAGVDGTRRAETLSPEEFAAIERALGPVTK
ncbi:16S rRNA (adenine(1518)-N(6)/adenine(1519)-N(6))-dimethyltransferase [Corallococcus sp. H22C18031201]|uniref:16S rRNA (adenine(1518)-N(6)/adenine(1519)-N(6))- dimethyltransferase RsmA n=1 Tax=Citreicoccus inhibens TaxID=2849499 RepID=UPI000E761687|nr:16S rRNA (adenine(1518)-N(6)/adenine(1519)-N(6))-dimethyltransferase RsmA [Citreicoccus inhibens]MBU8897713.1 16S rRNA (adenine(1518)-N(6)/adenine(1519)-N(6))-dimethyltransferase RsmA [Citreicoccus inhibens]RJS27483.1 16S rRNA (adenine(1518)-N(6)/adenine(1519)-N(6))-dimethyltransferase [Corallococcus sp. H22C18031201]